MVLNYFIGITDTHVKCLCLDLVREAFNKKNGEFSDIVKKSGRGSDQKPNFMNKEKK